MANWVSDQEAREQIIEYGRRIYEKGFVAANDGNLSVRVGENAVWCTPTGVSKGYMTEEMLIKMDLDGNILEQGSKAPTSEIKMHLRVYQEDPAIMSVVHAHPQVATALACAGEALNTQSYLVEGILAVGIVPCVHYARLGTYEIPDAVAPYVHTHNAVLLANHGALTWGRTAEEAYYRMETVEYCAKAKLLNEFVLQRYHNLTDDQIDHILSIRESKGIMTGGRPAAADRIENDRDVM